MAQERVRGVLLGLAAGDRIGGPIRMALCLADSLIDRKGFDRQDAAQSYFSWWRTDGFDTGPVTSRVFMKVKREGMPFDEAAEAYDRAAGGLTAGCNPAHRTAPLAMAPWISDGDLRAAAVSDAALTHAHRLAGAAAAATVCMCRALIRGKNWADALEIVSGAEDSEIRTAGKAVENRGQLDRGGFAPYVLQAAIYFVSSSCSFSEALERALEFAHASNYCPILVGSLGGARWGADAIPERHLEHCGVLERVQTVADAFAREWPRE